MDGMMMGLSDSSSRWAHQLSLIYNKIFHFHSSSIATATPNRHNETFTILIKFFRERAEQSHRIHLKSWWSGSHSSCVWGRVGWRKVLIDKLTGEWKNKSRQWLQKRRFCCTKRQKTSSCSAVSSIVCESLQPTIASESAEERLH